MNEIEVKEVSFIAELKKIIGSARRMAYSAINFAQVQQNWLIGQRIVEQEQNGKVRAEYGKRVVELASKELTKEFGRGFSQRNLENFRRFYLMFPNLAISQTVSAKSHFIYNQQNIIPQTMFAESGCAKNEKLSTQSPESEKDLAIGVRPISELNYNTITWANIQRIMRVSNPSARDWYLKEAAEQMWSYRTLDRNISTLYYERMLSSQAKDVVKNEMEEKTSGFQNDKLEFIKNPSVVEFLGLPSNAGYTETALEQAIINQMQKFLLELGKGFSFVARQQLIRTETQDFYIDLVFYNYILKCFVIVELKTDKLNHQDIGQLNMYVRMYDDLKRGDGDNPTIGILLCTETDKTIAQYSVLKENKQLFATKYIPYLPTEQELADEIERQKAMLKSLMEEKS
jgi:predicted nuclease of restriction endonuclease-like (RecB) superfamily